MLTKKRAALVVESFVVAFAVLCDEQICDVECKGNTVERQTNGKNSVRLQYCLLYCE